MINVPTDLKDIDRYFSIPHDRRVELLTKYVEAMSSSVIDEPTWLTAGVLLWASVRRVNSDLGMLRMLAKSFDDEYSLEEHHVAVREIMPLIKKLRATLPEDVSKFDEIVSYGDRHDRSWMGFAISEADMFANPYLLEINSTIVNRMFDVFEYDPHYVGLQLEIEQKKFGRIRFHSNHGMTDRNTTFETSIGEAIEKLMQADLATKPANAESVGPFQLQWLKWIFEAEHDNTLKDKLGDSLQGSGREWYVSSVRLKSCPEWKVILQQKANDTTTAKRTRSSLKTFLSLH